MSLKNFSNSTVRAVEHIAKNRDPQKNLKELKIFLKEALKVIMVEIHDIFKQNPLKNHEQEMLLIF